MIPIPSGSRVWIATGHTDMRRGMQGLALQVQEGLKRDPHGGDLFIFRGRREPQRNTNIAPNSVLCSSLHRRGAHREQRLGHGVARKRYQYFAIALGCLVQLAPLEMVRGPPSQVA